MKLQPHNIVLLDLTLGIAARSDSYGPLIVLDYLLIETRFGRFETQVYAKAYRNLCLKQWPDELLHEATTWRVPNNAAVPMPVRRQLAMLLLLEEYTMAHSSIGRLYASLLARALERAYPDDLRNFRPYMRQIGVSTWKTKRTPRVMLEPKPKKPQDVDNGMVMTVKREKPLEIYKGFAIFKDGPHYTAIMDGVTICGAQSLSVIKQSIRYFREHNGD